MKKKLIIALAPLAVLVGAHFALTLLDEFLTVGRMWETPAIRPHEAPIPRMADDVVPFGGGEARLRAMPAARLKPPFPLETAAALSAGKEGYFTYCAQCHGKYHDGNGTVGQSFSPLPGDLRDRRVQALSPGALFREISYGIPGGRQPPLATTIEASERWRIIAYVKSLGLR